MNTPLPAPPAKETSLLAIISLIAGITGFSILPFLGSVVAIITGHMARSEIHTQPERYQGDGLALTGLILGYVVVIGTVLSVLAAILFFGGLAAVFALVN